MLDTYRKILDLLNAREKKIFAALMGLVLLTGFANVLGIAALVPFFAVLADPGIVTSHPRIGAVYDMLGFSTVQDFLVVFGAAVFVAIVAGLAFRAGTTYALLRFGYMRSHTIAIRLLAGYLGQPYEWFLARHSADLGKTILSEVDHVISGSVTPAMRALAHVVMIASIVGLLFLVAPQVTLLAALFVGGSYLGIFFGVRRILTRAGKAKVEANKRRFCAVQEAFGGVKDVKLLGLERDYLERFRRHSRVYVAKKAKRTIIGQLPRYLLEGVASGGMVLLALALMAREGGALQAALPVLGLFAVAGARMLPEMQQLYACVTQMRFGRPALDHLHSDLRLLRPREGGGPAPAEPPIRLERSIELDSVCYAFPRAERPALDGLTLRIEARTTVGLVGGTGAGKTTAMDVMLGLLEPRSGALRIDGVAIGGRALRAWQRSVGYVPQQIFLLDDTVAANIALGIEPERIDRAALERAARIAEIHDFVVDEMPLGYDTPVGERGVRLSGGQRQRIGIARALYRDPDVLFFDEATSALDTLTERAVMNAVHTLGRAKTVVLIAHRLSTVRACDTIFLLDRGRLVAQGSYDELIEKSDRFRAMATAGA